MSDLVTAHATQFIDRGSRWSEAHGHIESLLRRIGEIQSRLAELEARLMPVRTTDQPWASPAETSCARADCGAQIPIGTPVWVVAVPPEGQVAVGKTALEYWCTACAERYAVAVAGEPIPLPQLGVTREGT